VIQPLQYDRETGTLFLLDQTLLPDEERYVQVKTLDELIEAIKALRVRGAPLLGLAGAYLANVLVEHGVNVEKIKEELEESLTQRVRQLAR